MKQLKVNVDNKPGVLAAVCEALANKDVDIRAISTEAVSAAKGFIRIIPDNTENAKHALSYAGFKSDEAEVLVVDVLDEPGSLAKITRRIANAGINIDSFYMLDRGLFALVVDRKDILKAKEMLGDRVVENS